MLYFRERGNVRQDEPPYEPLRPEPRPALRPEHVRKANDRYAVVTAAWCRPRRAMVTEEKTSRKFTSKTQRTIANSSR